MKSEIKAFSNEQIYVSEVFVGAFSVSPKIDSFSTWFISGFGVLLALIISNFASLISSNIIDIVLFKWAVIFYALAFIFSSAQKYIALFVESGRNSFIETAKIIAKVRDANVILDENVVYEEISSAVFSPGRWFIDRVKKKLDNGELLYFYKFLYKSCQTQMILVFLQMLTHLLTIVLLIFSIN